MQFVFGTTFSSSPSSKLRDVRLILEEIKRYIFGSFIGNATPSAGKVKVDGGGEKVMKHLLVRVDKINRFLIDGLIDSQGILSISESEAYSSGSIALLVKSYHSAIEETGGAIEMVKNYREAA
ncbi:hypothetical protein HK098_000452 [Nowakowskiella sp. JEL0407]|nr:hypothetical protein HK098_000452 [Nowakowskiella sp. JEL0407]